MKLGSDRRKVRPCAPKPPGKKFGNLQMQQPFSRPFWNTHSLIFTQLFSGWLSSRRWSLDRSCRQTSIFVGCMYRALQKLQFLQGLQEQLSSCGAQRSQPKVTEVPSVVIQPLGLKPDGAPAMGRLIEYG